MVFFIKLTKNGTLVADKKFNASTGGSASRTEIHGFKNVWTGRGKGGNGRLGLIVGKPKTAKKPGAVLEGFEFSDDICVSDPEKGTIYWVDPILDAPEPKKAKKAKKA